MFEGSWRGERRKKSEGDVSEVADEGLSWREEVLLRVGKAARGRHSTQPPSKLNAVVKEAFSREKVAKKRRLTGRCRGQLRVN